MIVLLLGIFWRFKTSCYDHVWSNLGKTKHNNTFRGCWFWLLQLCWPLTLAVHEKHMSELFSLKGTLLTYICDKKRYFTQKLRVQPSPAVIVSSSLLLRGFGGLPPRVTTAMALRRRSDFGPGQCSKVQMLFWQSEKKLGQTILTYWLIYREWHVSPFCDVLPLWKLYLMWINLSGIDVFCFFLGGDFRLNAWQTLAGVGAARVWYNL